MGPHSPLGNKVLDPIVKLIRLFQSATGFGLQGHKIHCRYYKSEHHNYINHHENRYKHTHTHTHTPQYKNILFIMYIQVSILIQIILYNTAFLSTFHNLPLPLNFAQIFFPLGFLLYISFRPVQTFA